MDPEKRNRILKLSIQAFVILVGLADIYAFSLAPKHAAWEYFAFLFSLLVGVVLLILIGRRFKQ